jgi:hypothetical protein
MEGEMELLFYMRSQEEGQAHTETRSQIATDFFLYWVCVIVYPYQPLHLLCLEIFPRGLSEPGYFLSRTALTNFLGVAVLASHEVPTAIAEHDFINFRTNFLRVISIPRKSLFHNPGNGPV